MRTTLRVLFASEAYAHVLTVVKEPDDAQRWRRF
jgi:hypothetical protein